MDIYVIPPKAHLELMNLGDRYFCLSQQYLKDENYRNFFKQKVAEGKWVTLDNGAGDFETVTRETVLQIARELQPSELIPLDILFDKNKTLENLEWTINEMRGDELLREIQVFACPQGNSFDDWIECYDAMIANPDVTTIGMSKIAVPWAISKSTGDKNIGIDRNSMYAYLRATGRLKKPLHFLGAGEAEEFILYKDDPLCRSTDSCFTVWNAMCGQLLEDPDYERISTPKDYFDRVIPEQKGMRDGRENKVGLGRPNDLIIKAIEMNVKYLQKCCK